MTKKNTVSTGADARSDSADAFIAEPEREEGPGGSQPDELAEYLGEGFVSSATGGEDGDDASRADLDFDALDDIDEGLVLGAGSDDDGMSAPGQDAERSRSPIRNDGASPMVRRRR
jgi:hypothetical protein